MVVAIVALGMPWARDRGAATAGRRRSAAAQPAGRCTGRVLRTGGRGGRVGRDRCARRCRCCPSRGSTTAGRRPRAGTSAARRGGLDARAIQPWAASPYLQLALLEEEAGQPRARRTAASARRSSAIAPTGASGSWRRGSRPRLVSYEGRRSLRRAERLNRKSPLFERPARAHAQALQRVRVKQAHLRRARRIALLAAATLVAGRSLPRAPRRPSGRCHGAAGLRLHGHAPRPRAGRRARAP